MEVRSESDLRHQSDQRFPACGLVPELGEDRLDTPRRIDSGSVPALRRLLRDTSGPAFRERLRVIKLARSGQQIRDEDARLVEAFIRSQLGPLSPLQVVWLTTASAALIGLSLWRWLASGWPVRYFLFGVIGAVWGVAVSRSVRNQYRETANANGWSI